MQTSTKCLALIRASEGFRPAVYLDARGLPRIGYGHCLVHPESFPNGTNEVQAGRLLMADVEDAEQAVLRMVKVPLAQGQFDALVDFVFSLDSGQLYGSALLADINAGRWEAAAQQILLWDNTGGEQSAGLTARRQAEFELFTGRLARELVDAGQFAAA